jgi:hypothetical protein
VRVVVEAAVDRPYFFFMVVVVVDDAADGAANAAFFFIVVVVVLVDAFGVGVVAAAAWKTTPVTARPAVRAMARDVRRTTTTRTSCFGNRTPPRYQANLKSNASCHGAGERNVGRSRTDVST